MKKGLSILILLLFIFPSLATAHTTLESSNPSDGQVITEPLKQIILNFENTLEKLSSLKVFQGSLLKAESIVLTLVFFFTGVLSTKSSPHEIDLTIRTEGPSKWIKRIIGIDIVTMKLYFLLLLKDSC
ncbi:copper resistance protein CopC [Gottfriedia acidiceleris]|uniref:copper resistance protein CopC n=1 Tax=Gottfriedia acidiceleris TaxID=371036 RepID=UPI00101B60E1|nr:copper resistance protein CopC [Gottfriedia acidiceleris]